MTDKTFLLTNYNTFSIKKTRIMLVILGGLSLVFSLASFLSTNKSGIQYNPFLSIMGVNFLLIGTIGLSKRSRYSPKFKITNDQIIMKEKIFSGQKALAWSSLNKIELGSFKITFFKPNHSFTFKLDTTKQTSIAIKQTLREVAATKNILVTGS